MSNDFRMLPSGNIEMTVVLMPDAYAALRQVSEEGMRVVDAVNLALMSLGEIAKQLRAQGKTLKDMGDEDVAVP